MAQDSVYVYWIDSGNAIRRTAKDGTIAATSPQGMAAGSDYQGIGVTNNVLEWGSNPSGAGYNGTLWYQVLSPLGSQHETGVSITDDYFRSIATGGGKFYWAVSGSTGIGPFGDLSAIMSTSPSGSTTTTMCGMGGTTLCTTSDPMELVVDATNVYWTDTWYGPNGGRVCKLPLTATGATAPTVLATGANFPWHIAVFGSYVYYQASSSLMQVPISGSINPVSIASTAGGGVAADASGVYWVDGNSVVYWLPAGSTTPVSIATSQGQPGYVIVDAAAIYWTNNTSGTVMAVAK
jgi:hypothetical protein